MDLPNITPTFDFDLLSQFNKIFVLVSGGVDSTYLYAFIKNIFPKKTYPVNCFNPFENNKTLSKIKKDKNFIEIEPLIIPNYNKIMEDAFLKIPEAREMLKKGTYSKTVFGCCQQIKRKDFKKEKMFLEEDAVIVSGIKAGDGRRRAFWLKKLRDENRFFHRHIWGALYCYPFRDHKGRELPYDVVFAMKSVYPDPRHSGCDICPVLVLFDIKYEGKRYLDSVTYANDLGVI